MSEPTQALAGDEPPVSSLDVPLPKRRIWPFIFIVVVVLGGGGFLVWRSMTAPFPLRVLVAVDVDGYWWEGSKPAAQFADELGDYLTRMGLEPVRAGDPETAAILEDAKSPLEAARKLRAAFVIQATFRPEVIELPIEGDFFEVHVDGPIQLIHTTSESTVIAEDVHTFSGAKDKDDALKYAAESAARHAFNAAMPAMMGHETIKEIVDGKDPKLVDQLSPAVNFTAARRSELDKAAGAYKDLEAMRMADEQVAAKSITFHSALDAEDRIYGIGTKGLLIVRAPVEPFYSPTSFELLRNIGLESIAWRPFATTTEDGESHDKQLWRGYNAFTYGSMATDGRPVVIVEDLYGWARAVTTVEVGGKVDRILVSPERRMSEPLVSPNGKAIAFLDRACKRCPKEVTVIDVVSRKEVWRLQHEDVTSIGDFAWLDDTRLMVVFQLSHPGDSESADALWGVDVRDGRRFTIVVPSGSAYVESPAASLDAKQVAVAHAGAQSVVSVTLSDDAAPVLKSHPVEGRASALSFSPDGSRVVFELRTKESRHPDIAALDIASSTVTRLTRNQSPDHNPHFGPEGKRIYFEARGTDPVWGRKRAVARIASVPAP